MAEARLPLPEHSPLKAVSCRNGDLLVQEQVTAKGKEQVLNSLGDAATMCRWGFQAILRSDPTAAAPFLQRAVSLDPNFAMAYVLMGANFANLGESDRAAESMRQAYERRGRTSELEKLNISASYEYLVTGNLEAARTAFELMAQTYPRVYYPHVDLTVIYAQLGEYEKSLREAQEARAHNHEGPSLHQTFYQIDFLQHHAAGSM